MQRCDRSTRETFSIFATQTRDGVNRNRFGLVSIIAVRSPVKARLARRLDSPIALELKEPRDADRRARMRKSSADRARGDSRLLRVRIPIQRPSPASSRRLDRYRDPQRRRAQSLLLWPLEKPRPDRSILVAGCGTSQAARHALMEPDARVTAIDISETSLRHTRDLQQKHDIRNLQLHRLAIERIGELGETFDQIVCTGVLHHLSDPDVGLRVAARCPCARRRDARHGLRALRPRRHHHDAGLLPAARDRRRGRRPARSWADGSSAAHRPSDRWRRETGEGFRAARRARRRVAEPPGPRLFRAAALRLARTVRPQVRALVRAGGLPSAVRSDRGRAAWRSPCRASRARPTCGDRAPARNDGPAQLRRLPRRPRTRSSADHIRGRGLAQLRSGSAAVDAHRSRIGRPPASPPCSSIRATPIPILRSSSTPRRSGSSRRSTASALSARFCKARGGDRRRERPSVFQAALGARPHRVRRETAA